MNNNYIKQRNMYQNFLTTSCVLFIIYCVYVFKFYYEYLNTRSHD